MNRAPPRSGPLAGLRVVELAGIGPGPFACMMLADMGAEIIRVAPPNELAYEGFIPQADDPVCRGRTRLVLNLKSQDGKKRLFDIVRRADALIEGFRPGVLERLQIGPSELLLANPKLVIGRVTGWGQDGVRAQEAGHDPNYLALSGALYLMGDADRPPPLPLNLVGDYGAGAMLLLTGVLAALLQARVSGQGQVVDAAMLDGAAQFLTPVYAMYDRGLWRAARGTNVFDGAPPFSRTYETKDSQYLAVCALEPPFYRNLVRGLGLNSAELPPQMDHVHWTDVGARFAAIFKTRTREEWIAIFDDSDACVSPVLTLSEARAHPHNISRKIFDPNTGLPAPAPRFSATPSAMAAQDIGDADALIRRWGV